MKYDHLEKIAQSIFKECSEMNRLIIMIVNDRFLNQYFYYDYLFNSADKERQKTKEDIIYRLKNQRIHTFVSSPYLYASRLNLE